MTPNPNSTEQEELRQAIDDSVLIHTGRSIGDRASQEVIDEIWPLIIASQRQAVQRFAEGLLKKLPQDLKTEKGDSAEAIRYVHGHNAGLYQTRQRIEAALQEANHA